MFHLNGIGIFELIHKCTININIATHVPNNYDFMERNNPSSSFRRMCPGLFSRQGCSSNHQSSEDVEYCSRCKDSWGLIGNLVMKGRPNLDMASLPRSPSPPSASASDTRLTFASSKWPFAADKVSQVRSMEWLDYIGSDTLNINIHSRFTIFLSISECRICLWTQIRVHNLPSQSSRISKQNLLGLTQPPNFKSFAPAPKVDRH